MAKKCSLAIASAVLVSGLLPLPAWAQAYKCKQPNGSVAFQDRPCESATQGSSIALPDARPPTQAPGERPAANARTRNRESSEGQRRSEEVDRYNAEVMAQNKATECARARRNLGVLREEKPVYTYNNTGGKNYVEDKDRARLQAEAQQQVNQACN